MAKGKPIKRPVKTQDDNEKPPPPPPKKAARKV
jgi:hypothetical protein